MRASGFDSTAWTIASLVGVMVFLAAVETLIPLRPRGRSTREVARRVVPNLLLTLITFATNAVLNGAMIAGLAAFEARGMGVLPRLGITGGVALVTTVLMLDLSFYLAHVSMHKVAAFWLVHRVHHSDCFVDVTTSIRQHPLEGLIRYTFTAAFGFFLGSTPAAFAVYRTVSAVNALFEHANVDAPSWFDRSASLVTTWPHMHKVHHSRTARETDSNYGNIFSLWDRLFGTFTPSERGRTVAYGLDGLDEDLTATTRGLLRLPFVDGRAGGPVARRHSAA